METSEVIRFNGIDVDIKLSKDAYIPTKATTGATGYDVYLKGKKGTKITIKPKETVILDTGVSCNYPKGYDLQVRSRSGLSSKEQLLLLNGVGTIDSDYRGTIKLPLFNLSDKDVEIEQGQRIGQLVMLKTVEMDFKEVDNHKDITDRGTQGFGSTGK